MIVALLLFSLTQACIYTQSYWLSNQSEPWPISPLLNQSLCGLSWYTLMHLNTSQTQEPASMYWLIAFHQLCTAQLNLCIDEKPVSGLPSDVALSSQMIFDSMQRYCQNLSAWVETVARDQILMRNLELLIRYNHGDKVCQSTRFSFTQEPQLFFLGYNETEQSEVRRQASIQQHVYTIQTLLTVFSGLSAFLVIPALVIYIIMIRNYRREYSLFKTAVETDTYNVSANEANKDYEDPIDFSEEMLDVKEKTI